MDNSSLRQLCFWVTLISGVVWLGLSTITAAAAPGMMRQLNSDFSMYARVFGVGLEAINLAGLVCGVLHSISLFVLMALLHRDLGTCERWVSYERGRLVSGESGRLTEDPGAGSVGPPESSNPGSRTQPG